MSPLAPPDPSAPPWRFCRACGSPYLEGRDTLCKRCKSPVGERGLILNAGGGPGTGVVTFPDPSIISANAAAQVAGTGQSLTIGSLAYSADDWVFIWGAFDATEQQPQITVGGGVPILHEAVAGMSSDLQLYLAKYHFTLADTGGTSSGIATVDVVNGSNGTTVLGIAAMVARSLDQTSPIGPLVVATGTSTTPDSGLSGATTVARSFLVGMVLTEGPPGDAAGTWDNGFTDSARGGATPMTLSLGWKLVQQTGTYSAAKSGVTSRQWIAYLACLKGRV